MPRGKAAKVVSIYICFHLKVNVCSALMPHWAVAVSASPMARQRSTFCKIRSSVGRVDLREQRGFDGLIC